MLHLRDTLACTRSIKSNRKGDAAMSYIVAHEGTFWFQIRVPKSLKSSYGASLIRQNLQTRDPQEAKTLALQLASHWLRHR